MQRLLEPEVMDTSEEAIEYDAMDFTAVNTTFAQCIALRANVRTVFQCCIYTFSYSFKLFKSLFHRCF
jgi:hypothetical protein